jgi:hypothetical protein
MDGGEDVLRAEISSFDVFFFEAEGSGFVHSVVVLVLFVVRALFGSATDKSLHLLIFY